MKDCMELLPLANAHCLIFCGVVDGEFKSEAQNYFTVPGTSGNLCI